VRGSSAGDDELRTCRCSAVSFAQPLASLSLSIDGSRSSLSAGREQERRDLRESRRGSERSERRICTVRDREGELQKRRRRDGTGARGKDYDKLREGETRRMGKRRVERRKR